MTVFLGASFLAAAGALAGGASSSNAAKKFEDLKFQTKIINKKDPG
jgi:hypothetical protein